MSLYALVPVAMLACLGSWLATRLVLILLRRLAILDRPNARSSHTQPTPRGGGLGLLCGLVPVWIYVAWASGNGWGAGVLLAAAAPLAVISWLDDLRPRPAWLRFGIQVLAVIVGLQTFPPDASLSQGVLPPLLDRGLVALLWLWFINAYNFMDGIDGLAGVETLSIGAGVAALWLVGTGPAPSGAYGLILAAAALGFLPWNWHRAKLFLGDVGSIPLGFLCGWLLLSLALHGAWAAALILPGYYLADASLTLARRVLTGHSPFEAHRTHFYQRAASRLPHDRVVWAIALCNLLLILLAASNWGSGIQLAVAALVVAVLCLWLHRAGQGAGSPQPG